MGRQFLRTQAASLGLIVVLAAGSPMLRAQTPTPVPKLDDDQMRATWYEIARLPNKREKSCIGDAFELIARGDSPNSLTWVASCKTKTAYINVHNTAARPQDKKNPNDGRLKVITIWPFTAKYWVLAVDHQLAWFLIGTPNHKKLWIYAKSPTLAPEVLAQIEAQATAEGYPSAKLVFGPQTVAPANAPPALLAP